MVLSNEQSPSEKLKTQSKWGKLFRLVSMLLLPFAAGVAIFLLVKEGSQLRNQAINLNLPLVGLSFLISCSGFLIAILVWRRILKSYDVRQSLRQDIKIYSYSTLALVLPGGIWSIVSRSTMYQRLGVRALPVATASLVETLIIGVASLGVFAGTTIIRPDLSLWERPELGIAFALVAFVLIQPGIFNRIINWMLMKIHREDSYLYVDFNLRELVLWIGLEMIVIIIGGGAVFVLLSSLTSVPDSSLITAIAAWAAASVAGNLLFFVPGTLILRDGAMILALTTTFPLPVALLFVLIVRLWAIASLLVVAGIVWATIDLPIKLKRKDKMVLKGENLAQTDEEQLE